MIPQEYFRHVFTCLIIFGLFFSSGITTAQPANSKTVAELDTIFSAWDSSNTPG